MEQARWTHARLNEGEKGHMAAVKSCDFHVMRRFAVNEYSAALVRGDTLSEQSDRDITLAINSANSYFT